MPNKPSERARKRIRLLNGLLFNVIIYESFMGIKIRQENGIMMKRDNNHFYLNLKYTNNLP
jgi:hypothetical protein